MDKVVKTINKNSKIKMINKMAMVSDFIPF